MIYGRIVSNTGSGKLVAQLVPHETRSPIIVLIEVSRMLLRKILLTGYLTEPA